MVAQERGGVLLAPFPERSKHGDEGLTRSGEEIFVARRVGRVLAARDHPGILERAQPRGERLARSAGVMPDVVETRRPQGELAQDEQRPALSDELERVGDPAHTRTVHRTRFA